MTEHPTEEDNVEPITGLVDIQRTASSPKARAKFPEFFVRYDSFNELFPVGTCQNEAPYLPSIEQYFNEIVGQLRVRARNVDVRDVVEFHGLLWMMARLGPTVPKTLCREFGAAESQVSRWCQAKVTPRGTNKRTEILRLALAALTDDLQHSRQPIAANSIELASHA